MNSSLLCAVYSPNHQQKYRRTDIYMVAQKSKPLPDDQKSHEIAWKPFSEIRFIRKIKVWIKHYNIIQWC